MCYKHGHFIKPLIFPQSAFLILIFRPLNELQNLQNLHYEKLRLANITEKYGHENMYAKDYSNPDGVGEDDRIGMTSEKNQMLLRRIINTGLQEVKEL